MKLKIVLELENEPKKDDILVFNGEKFECVSKSSFLRELKDINIALDNVDKALQKISEDIRILKGEDE